MLMRIAILSTCLAVASSAATAQQEVDGHPLVTPYEGVNWNSGEAFEYNQYRLITGFDFETREPTGITVEGRVTRLYHANPEGRSEFEIFSNYLAAFENVGFEAIFNCSGDGECFTGSTRNSYRMYNGFGAMNGGNSRYAAGTLSYDGRLAYIAFGVGRRGTAIDIVETSEMETGLVSVTAEALAQGLQAQGHVRVDGLLFAVDAADLLPESATALQALADLLAAQPDLDLYIVGHTDMSGSLGHNLNLSRRRAQSVIDALAADHGINASRLDAQGVGPLAPETTNSTENGRGTNRRVEIVVR